MAASATRLLKLATRTARGRLMLTAAGATKGCEYLGVSPVSPPLSRGEPLVVPLVGRRGRAVPRRVVPDRAGPERPRSSPTADKANSVKSTSREGVGTLANGITIEGLDLGVAWQATIDSTNVDNIALEVRPHQRVPHRARFVTATPFGSGPDGDIFSTWPDGYNGPRWVIVVLSIDVHNMNLRYDSAERSIAPVRIATSRIPQLAIFSVTRHPAKLDLYGNGDDPIGTVHLDDPCTRRNGQLRDFSAPAPIGQMTQILGS